MTITIYGSFCHYHSHSQVSKGLVRGLLRNGLHDIRLVDCNGMPTTDENDLPMHPTRPRPSGPGLYIGGYPPMAMRWLEPHEPRGALFICESWSLPEDWLCVAQTLDLLVVPSAWAKETYKAGRVVRHGLDAIYSTSRQAHRILSTPLVFGHVCGAASFPERKGTPQLVQAFAQVFQPGEAVLDLRLLDVPPAHGLAGPLEGDPRFRFTWSTSTEPQEAMRRWYEQLDALIQPSRAEAFGICPLEARALGIPVVLTDTGGHRDHLTLFDTVIRTGPMGVIAVQGIPNGTAPIVTTDAVAEVLERVKQTLPAMAENARQHVAGYYAKWRWTEVARPMAKFLKESKRWR